MKIDILETETFKLDGGAIFGVVPKSLWSRNYPCDENNMIKLRLRCLLITDGDRKILIDSGMGNKYSEKFLSHFYLDYTDTLEKSLRNLGLSPDDITDNIFSHLHFDHCGGSVIKDKETNQLTPFFKNATHWVSKQQWDNAHNPNLREKASYFPQNYQPLFHHGQMKFIKENFQFTPNIYLKLYHGHTPGQIIPYITDPDKKQKYIFTCDLIPLATHLHHSYVMSFDMQPLVTIEEIQETLNSAVEENIILIFEHDYYTECCTVKKENGRFLKKESFTLPL